LHYTKKTTKYHQIRKKSKTMNYKLKIYNIYKKKTFVILKSNKINIKPNSRKSHPPTAPRKIK
ncbi:hypothetical protein ACQWHJ_25225, partial [Salmonella enterica subsp. enterica serovar Infantis]